MSMGNPKKLYGSLKKKLKISDFFAFMVSCFDVIGYLGDVIRYPKVLAGSLEVFSHTVHPIPRTRAA